MEKLLAVLRPISDKSLISWITLLGTLLGVWVIFIHQGRINDDAVLYLEMARLFADGQWRQALALYNWPLYPVLIAAVSRVSGMDMQWSAYALSVIAFGVTSFALVTLIHMAGGGRRAIAGGALLLFSATYIVGDILPMIVRDHGFWATFLLSLVFFIRYCRNGTLADALLWQLTAVLAVLFRVEAITYLALLPLVIFCQPPRSAHEKWKAYIQANLLSLVGLTGLGLAMLLSPSLQISDLGRLTETYTVVQNSYLQMTQGLSEKADLLHATIFTEFSWGYALLGLLLTLLSILVLKIASTAGWISMLLLGLACLRKNTSRMDQDVKRTLIWAGLLTLLNMSMILLQNFLLSGRYVIALAFILLIFAAFGLAAIGQAHPATPASSKRRHWLLAVIVTALAIGLLQNLLPKPTGYNHERDAGRWVQLHGSDKQRVFFVSPRVRYFAGAPYAGRGWDYWQLVNDAIRDGSIHHYDMLVINVDSEHAQHADQLMHALPQYTLVKQFHKLKSKERILIFSRR